MEREMAEITTGAIINNGFYHIELTEPPHWNDTHSRWMARGYRWVPSRKNWEAKPRLYGWDDAHNKATTSPSA